MLTISKFGTLPVAVLAIIILGELATLAIMTSMMTPTAFAQPTQQQRQSSTNDDISVLSSSVERTDFGFSFIIGEIRNDSPEAVGTVTIVASFYDSGGTLIDTSSTFAELQQLRPGEKSPFRMAISDESILERMDNYTLSVEANPVFGGVKPAALRVDVSEQRLNEFDQYEIVGQVTNTGSRDTTLVQVIANFYDETGRLIDTQFTFLASDLPAGQSGPFKITVSDGERANEAASVKLITESSDYVMIDPELEQQQQQSLQGMSQQQNETAMTAPSSSQTTTEPLSTNAATSGSNIGDSADGGIDAEVINQLTARAMSYAEQANTALQSNDTEGASRNLNFALNELENIQGNLTSSTSGSNSAGSTNGDSNASSQTTTSSTPSSQPQQQQPPSSPSPFSQQLQSQQQEQEEGPPQQQSLQQEQNEGGATVSIVEGSSALTTDAYSPNPVQVSVGGTVTWTNDDSQPHTVNSGENATPSGVFDSPIMAPQATFEHTFTEAGEYPYFCILHPNQGGTVSVG
jgi:plastocyanin